MRMFKVPFWVVISFAVAWQTVVAPVFGQAPSNMAVRVSAEIQVSPPSITLTWPADSSAVRYEVYRKLKEETVWSGPVTLEGSEISSYLDNNVVLGGAYEYKIRKWTDQALGGEGYIYAGIQVPLVESRGKVILIVENSFTASLSSELARLQRDLVGDGWIVLRHDVPRMAVDPGDTSPTVWAARSNELASVKALIRSDYVADSNNVKAVFIIGHVPVPYSGDIDPDYHTDHQGAWPADGFYGEMDGNWTDTTVNRTTASDPRNRNVPGDGKFDRISWPPNASGLFNVELQVGRVDMAELPAFSESEEALLRQYLNKDHRFRNGSLTVERRGLIDDNLGNYGGEAPAQNGWQNFAPFFGATNTFEGDWNTTESYLWGYGCGAGTFTSCSGVTTTSQLAAGDPPVVFAMLFGSYFGDWDSENNLMRASLATPTYTLTCVWSARPGWHFHHMALGETIGYSTLLVQNNDGLLYSANGMQRMVHVALMGDPTLRMHIVAPASNLVVTANGTGGADLRWNASPDTVLGYHVYHAATADGPFTRLNSSLINDTNYTDSSGSSGVYMVRAVKLEVSGSGSYYNASEGIFQSLSTTPVLTVTAQNTNKVYGAPLPELTAVYSGFVNGDATNDLDTQAVLSTTATDSSPVGDYPITVSGATSTKYDIHFVEGTLSILPATTTGNLTSSANPALPGAPVTFTLSLAAVAPGAGTPTGSVQFKIDGVVAGSPVALSGGEAQYLTSALAAGTHTVVAEYAGDGNFIGATNTLAPAQVINTPPVAAPDEIWRSPSNGVQVAITYLLSNDTDADGNPLTFASVSPTSDNGGTVVSNANWILYTPPTGFTNTDSFHYSISDGIASPVLGTVTVGVLVDNGPSQNLTILDLGNGSYRILADGIPGRTYRFQWADNVENPAWQTLGSVTADAFGVLEYVDTPPTGTGTRYYRTIEP